MALGGTQAPASSSSSGTSSAALGSISGAGTRAEGGGAAAAAATAGGGGGGRGGGARKGVARRWGGGGGHGAAGCGAWASAAAAAALGAWRIASRRGAAAAAAGGCGMASAARRVAGEGVWAKRGARRRASGSRRRPVVRPLAAAAAAAGAPGGAPGLDWQQLAASLKAGSWDDRPRKWRTFWNVQTIAAVIDADAATGDVSGTSVEAPGLRLPQTAAETVERVERNAAFYKQNYACVLVGAVALALMCVAPAALTGYACALASAIVTSDRLLGETQLATGGWPVFNEQRVAGLDRPTVRIGLLSISVSLLVAALPTALVGLVQGLLMGAVLCVTHMVVRPVSIESTLGNMVDDLKNAKNREELVSSVKKAGKGLGGLFRRFVNEEPRQPEVYVRVKNDPNAPPPPSEGGAPGGGSGATPAPGGALPPGSK